ncbi:MAG: tetratricopeptide repeat protein, partial [Planctomycetia bacterium]
MGVNKRRLAIVAAVATVLTATAVGVYAVRFRTGPDAAALQASAEQFLAAGDFASAKIEVDKMLRGNPKNGWAHYLKAQTLLEGKSIVDVRAADSQSINALKSLVQAVRVDPSLTDVHKSLLTYFANVADWTEAAEHAKPVLEKNPADADAQFAMANRLLQQKKYAEAGRQIVSLAALEKPARPRTAWLSAEAGDALGRSSDLSAKAEALVDSFAEFKPTATNLDDALGLVELHRWSAERSNEPRAVKHHVTTGAGLLEAALAASKGSDTAPRRLLDAAGRLTPKANQRKPAVAATYAALQPRVDALSAAIYTQALDAGVLDPALYLRYAGERRRDGQAEDAARMVEKGIKSAEAAGPEVRQAFAVCDLWLAEHYLGQKQSKEAQPHIEVLLRVETLKPWGRLLAGYQAVQDEEFERAAASLQEAVEKMPANGAAHALLGLAQLRRGLVSEGRRHLEDGVKLGADQPQYKAWLTLALAEAGYQKQAEDLASQLLADPGTQSLGRALQGQLQFRAGRFDQAEKDFSQAVLAAPESARATLQLSQAQAAAARGEVAKARKLLEELKDGPQAAMAAALEVRILVASNEREKAVARLADARKQFPRHPTLLRMEVARLVDEKRFGDALALAEAEQAVQPLDASLVQLVADVHLAAGEPEKSLDALRRGAARFPQEPTLALRLAERLLDAKRYDDANRVLADLKGNVKVNPTSIDFLLARSAAMQGDAARAEKTIRNAAKHDPDNPNLKFLLGQFASQKGDFDSAAEMFNQSLAGGSFQDRTVEALFESLLRTGDADRAAQVLNDAAGRGKALPGLRGKLLQYLTQREDWPAAEKEVGRLLEGEPTTQEVVLAAAALRVMKRADEAMKTLDAALAKKPDDLLLLEHKVLLLFETKKFAAADAMLTTLLEKNPKNASLHSLR